MQRRGSGMTLGIKKRTERLDFFYVGSVEELVVEKKEFWDLEEAIKMV